MIIDPSLSIQHCQAQFCNATEVIKGSRKLAILSTNKINVHIFYHINKQAELLLHQLAFLLTCVHIEL